MDQPRSNSESIHEGSPNGGVFVPENLELYSYTLNNPLNLRDPNGRFWKELGNAVSGRMKSWTLALVDMLPVKPDSPNSTAFLRHYVEGSGDNYVIKDVP